VKRKFYTLDVFTDAALSGNPLAVVMDSAGLDAMQMQRIAREFNLSETVFVFEPYDPVNTARLRIFTPGAELPFAGHPTIGTAILLAQLRAPELLRAQDLGVVLEEPIGFVRCSVRHRKGQNVRASFDVPKLPEQMGEGVAPERIAAALGVDIADIGFDDHRPSVYSAGSRFHFIPLNSLEAIARARPVSGVFEEVFGQGGRPAAYLYTHEVMQADSAFHARMFAPGLGIAEDPATGSAVAAFAGAVVAFDRPSDGDHTLVIEQGFEMGRPSLITLGLDVAGGVLVGASIGGGAVRVSEGILDL
jgi:trans-2,3-dihydro-3-hydroxyanthranilate isomerase